MDYELMMNGNVKIGQKAPEFDAITRREKILSESTMQRLRNRSDINTKSLNTICVILKCQPSDIFKVIVTDKEKIKYF